MYQVMLMSGANKRRLCVPLCTPVPPAPRAREQFAPLNSLDGIIVELTRGCGGNVHDFGVVDVTLPGLLISQWTPSSGSHIK
jgi:hypothetical protein